MNGRRRNDDGSALVMAIVVVLVVGITSAALLDFGTTGFKVSKAVVGIRNDQHAVDSAMDGAINALRRSSEAGFAGDPTCDPASPVPFVYDPPSGAPDPTVQVTCQGDGTSTGGLDDTMPKYAVLTLGTDPAEGFRQTDGSNKTLTIDGGIFSNSQIAVGGTNFDFIKVFGDATAVDDCVNGDHLFATGAKRCNVGLGAKADDPNYPAAITALSDLTAVDPDASCKNNNSDSVIRFSPGFYSENPRAAIPAGCTGKVWWFTPGKYYFDFPDSASLWDLHADHVSIVGGTNAGTWNANTKWDAVPFPGACDPGPEDAPNPGVQFVFGGQTRLLSQTADEKIELCGQAWPGTQQRIVFYGWKTGNRGPTTTDPEEATTATANPVTGFVPAGAATHADGVPAVAALDGSALKSAELDLSDFGNIPEGSTVEQAWIDVAHSESGTTSKLTNTVVVNGKPGHDVPIASSFTPVTSIDVTSDLGTTRRWKAVNNLSVQYMVDGTRLKDASRCPGKNCTPAETATASVDAITLRVRYTPPALEGHRCPTAEPDCKVLETLTNPTALFHGTFYAPTARVAVNVHNGGLTVFERGIIARTIVGDVSSSSKQDTAPFQLPGANRSRTVILTASVNGTARLRAKVKFTDSKYDPAAAKWRALPGYKVDVLDWAYL